MKRHHIIQNLIAICVATGCTLEEPCQNDEIYSAGSCIKCRDYGDHHIGADGYCVKDTIEACGEGLTNCREIEGASDVGCIHGKCQILRCDDSRGYEFDNNRCIQGEAFSCGTDRINCVSDWLPKVYADQSWTAGSTPLCAEGQCMIGTCAPGYEHIRCADYIDRYAADYQKEYGDSFSIPLCESESNQDTTICLKYICPLSGSSLQKQLPVHVDANSPKIPTMTIMTESSIVWMHVQTIHPNPIRIYGGIRKPAQAFAVIYGIPITAVSMTMKTSARPGSRYNQSVILV